MTRHIAAFALAVAACVCGERAEHYVEIRLPPGVASERLFVRYALTGDHLGDWLQPRAGLTSYRIGTGSGGRAAAGIRAILYAPGCALQILDAALPRGENPAFLFVCQPARSIRISGTIARPGGFAGHRLTVQAKYVARWAQPFLGLDASIVTSIPVSDPADVSPDRRFSLTVPDLPQDAGHPGELQLWAREGSGGDLLAQLIPARDSPVERTKMGGLRIQDGYPSAIPFSLCGVNDAGRVHDKYGFVTRPLADDCGR